MGLTFLVAGIAGFIPGITSDYDELKLAGTDSNAELLGILRVSILHLVLSLAMITLGPIGLAAEKRSAASGAHAP